MYVVDCYEMFWVWVFVVDCYEMFVKCCACCVYVGGCEGSGFRVGRWAWPILTIGCIGTLKKDAEEKFEVNQHVF